MNFNGAAGFLYLGCPLQNALHTEPSSPKIQTSYNLSKAGFAHRDSRSGERNESPGSNLLTSMRSFFTWQGQGHYDFVYTANIMVSR